MEIDYKQKYLKYKQKYIDLREQLGSGIFNTITISDFVDILYKIYDAQNQYKLTDTYVTKFTKLLTNIYDKTAYKYKLKSKYKDNKQYNTLINNAIQTGQSSRYISADKSKSFEIISGATLLFLAVRYHLIHIVDILCDIENIDKQIIYNVPILEYSHYQKKNVPVTYKMNIADVALYYNCYKIKNSGTGNLEIKKYYTDEQLKKFGDLSEMELRPTNNDCVLFVV